MKTTELRQKSKDELHALLETTRTELDDLQFQIRQNKVKNVKEAGKRKKDIARILTLLAADRSRKRGPEKRDTVKK